MRKPLKPPALSLCSSASRTSAPNKAMALKLPFMRANVSSVIWLFVPLALPVTITARSNPSVRCTLR